MTRVLLIVVDGCTSRVLGPELDAGRLPTMKALADRGTLRLDCRSIFPSITPAATASIVTGRYPARHGITGMSWWNPDTQDVSYFGDDVRTVLRRGLDDFLHGFLLELNGGRLTAPTMFSLAERHGRRAACFNHLIFRGDVAHRISPPLLMRLLSSLDDGVRVHGPSWLCLGQIVPCKGAPSSLRTLGGTLNRFGLDDAATEAFLLEVPRADALPDLSVAYFADYDFDSHERGPDRALDTLRRFDERLSHVFTQWGGVDEVLDHVCVMLTSDHSHSLIADEEEAGIGLDHLRESYRCATPGSGWREADELLVCPNMRAAEIYVRRPAQRLMADVCRHALGDRRVDHVIWRQASEFVVATADRGSLRFAAAPDGSGVADEYGGHWDIRGDLSAIDAVIEEDQVVFRRYPNALERIANGAAHDGAARLWVTARPGYEFSVPGQTVHRGGGSHGSLHELDSVVPLLIAGAGCSPPTAWHPRIVDIAPLIAACLGVPFPTRAGQSHSGE